MSGNKKIITGMAFICLLILFVSIGNISASDINNSHSINDLNTTINGNLDDTIYLDYDYAFQDNDSAFENGIEINRNVTIDGRNHVIDGKNQIRLFHVMDNTCVVFKYMHLINGYAGTQGYGGAIWGPCTAENCLFENNHANYGGAMAEGNAVKCHFNNNTAFEIWNDEPGFGGAMFHGTATECAFKYNYATTCGGALYGVNAYNCYFERNSAVYGGAMIYGLANESTFIQNVADDGDWDGEGGAIDQGTAINCLFIENRAKLVGGAISGRCSNAINCRFFDNEDSTGEVSEANNVGCTFINNIASEKSPVDNNTEEKEVLKGIMTFRMMYQKYLNSISYIRGIPFFTYLKLQKY